MYCIRVLASVRPGLPRSGVPEGVDSTGGGGLELQACSTQRCLSKTGRVRARVSRQQYLCTEDKVTTKMALPFYLFCDEMTPRRFGVLWKILFHV